MVGTPGKIAIVLAVVAGAGLAVAVVLSAGAPSLTVSPSTIAQLGTLSWKASGLKAGDQAAVTVLLNTGGALSLLPNLTVGGDGTISASFQVGTNIPKGVNTLQVVDVGTGTTVSANFTVT